MIYHLVTLDDWLATPNRAYAPDTLLKDGLVHCSPDEETILAMANAFYGKTPGPLMVLLIDENKVDVPIRWEVVGSEAILGVAADTLLPLVGGSIDRSAVVGMMELHRDAEGRADKLCPWADSVDDKTVSGWSDIAGS